ncbi:MAG: hypothetical protein KA712_01245 [Myxococcales bacterium]|nr:hypothetical protein [Myxococcales bacterium]
MGWLAPAVLAGFLLVPTRFSGAAQSDERAAWIGTAAALCGLSCAVAAWALSSPAQSGMRGSVLVKGALILNVVMALGVVGGWYTLHRFDQRQTLLALERARADRARFSRTGWVGRWASDEGVVLAFEAAPDAAFPEAFAANFREPHRLVMIGILAAARGPGIRLDLAEARVQLQEGERRPVLDRHRVLASAREGLKEALALHDHPYLVNSGQLTGGALLFLAPDLAPTDIGAIEVMVNGQAARIEGKTMTRAEKLASFGMAAW